ncbi:uncharacterized protein A1O9_11093 [Exophiala aquamarina CBS 119918]|uniref:Preprotein translocase subunit YidC n=1 Tax=Exophiala aquamarina CBS 119918 TaxID=1182545 RepID=A0A072NYM3_9EURO|nr:uncharacterized protein A1O9_11093 [Exophiala aquamarina CBS 119918]KEF52676.1 hypothetical protein A1O9_11093 [Exophiala aquamarina CBS 119918]
MSSSHFSRFCVRFTANRSYLHNLKPNPHIRNFHPSRSNYLLPELLQLSHAAFQGVHDLTGLSWVYSIPLTAALFRASWIPVQCIIARNRRRRLLVSQPLLAWRQIYRKSVPRPPGPPTDEDAAKANEWVKQKLGMRQLSLRRDLPYMNLKWEFILPLTFLPIWFLNAETIRRMSGDTRTALAWIGGRGHVDDSPESVLVPLEPGFELESMAWTSDLVSSDPFLILPGIFLFLSVWNARIAVGKAPDTNVQNDLRRTVAGRLSLELPQAIQTIAFVFPLILMWQGIPSAVILYLIGSAATMIVQRPLINRLMGETKVIKPLNARLPEEISILGTSKPKRRPLPNGMKKLL